MTANYYDELGRVKLFWQMLEFVREVTECPYCASCRTRAKQLIALYEKDCHCDNKGGE